MDDLISRAAAIEYLMTNIGWHDEDGYPVDDSDEKRAIITDLVNGIPAVDAVTVEWLKKLCDSYDYNLFYSIQLKQILKSWEIEKHLQNERRDSE